MAKVPNKKYFHNLILRKIKYFTKAITIAVRLSRNHAAENEKCNEKLFKLVKSYFRFFFLTSFKSLRSL